MIRDVTEFLRKSIITNSPSNFAALHLRKMHIPNTSPDYHKYLKGYFRHSTNIILCTALYIYIHVAKSRSPTATEYQKQKKNTNG